MFYSAVYNNIGSSSVAATLTVGVDDGLFVFLNYNFIPGSGTGGSTAVCCLTATPFSVTLQPGRNVFHFFGRNVGGPGYVVWSLAVGNVVVARSDMNSRIGPYGAVKLQNGGFQQSTSFSNSPGWTFAGGGAANEYNTAAYAGWLVGMAPLASNAVVGAGLSIYAPDADTFWGVLQNKASMTTTYTNFVVGATYVIYFWGTSRMCCTPNQVNDLGVAISGVGSVFYNSAVGSVVYSGNVAWFWQPFMTSQFTATSTTHSITFTTTNPRAQTDVTTFIDDVRVVATSCPSLTGKYYMPRAEVFGTAGYTKTPQQAQATCNAFGARVATTQEMYQAQRDGGDWCSCSWVQEGVALYPITTTFSTGCGGFDIGVRQCGSQSWVAGNLFAVACWGMKPATGTAGVLAFNSVYWNNPTAVDPVDPYYGVARVDTPGGDLQCKEYENGYNFEQCRAECDNNVLCNQVEEVAPNTLGNWGFPSAIPLTLTGVSSTFAAGGPMCCGGSLAIDGNGLGSEWASAAEGVGAWISVSLTNGPATVSTLKIAPRQPGGGACDTVSGLSVQFSDGTTQALTFPCGSYPEGYQTFTVNKLTSSLKFTVTGVCGVACNIGLSDIIAFSAPNGAGCCIKNYPVGTVPTPDTYGTWHAKTASCQNVGVCTNAVAGQYYSPSATAYYSSTCPVSTCASASLLPGQYYSGISNPTCTGGVSTCTAAATVAGLIMAAPCTLPPSSMTAATSVLGGGSYTATGSSTWTNGAGFLNPWKAFTPFTSSSFWASMNGYNTDGSYGGTSSNLGSSGENAATVVGSTTYAGEWLQFQMPVGSPAVTSYSFSSRSDGWIQSPTSWVLAGSTNGVAFTLIEARTSTWLLGQTQYFTLTAAATYTYLRIIVLTIGGAGWAASISNLNFYTAATCNTNAINAVWTSPGSPGNGASCGWKCAPGYLPAGSACAIPPPPPSPPPPPPTDPMLPTPFSIWSDPTTSQTGNFVLPTGVTYGSGAYTVATFANPGIVHYLGLNKVFSQQPCPGNTGFSFMFKMQLTNAATVNSIADGVSVCFMDATAASPASASLPAAWGQYGFASMHVPGMCFGTDTWYNVGNGGVGFAAWHTAAAGDAGMISSAYAIPPASNNLLPIIANGNAMEHQIDYDPAKQTLTWRIGGTAVLAAVTSAYLPASFFVTWPVVCGGMCDTVQVSAVSMSCAAYPSPPPPSPPPPSPPPPSPPPPSPPPSPPPPSPPWSAIAGPAPLTSCFDVDVHYVGVDYPVQPFAPGTKSVPAGYAGVVQLQDRGTLGLAGTLSSGAVYTEATGRLSVAGSNYVAFPAITLGLPTHATLGGALIQNGFSVLADVVAPTPLPATQVTVFSMGNDATGATGAVLRVTLLGSNYELFYGLAGSTSLKSFPLTATNGVPLPAVTAGSTAKLLVRCFPGMSLCVLTSY
jgi:hypothetical protein